MTSVCRRGDACPCCGATLLVVWPAKPGLNGRMRGECLACGASLYALPTKVSKSPRRLRHASAPSRASAQPAV